MSPKPLTETLLMDQTSYSNQSQWEAIMANLPQSLQLSSDQLPQEETWNWKGNGVHIDRYDTPNAKCKVILHHGVGTNGRQMTLLIGQRLSLHGYAVVAPDNLGYGVTEVTQSKVKFDDWVDLLSDLIDKEVEKDGLPVFLFGLSAGGMISYHAAGKNKKVKGIVGLTFLDERIKQVCKETVIHPLIAPLVPLVNALGNTPVINRIKIPMKWVSKMYTLTNDKKLLKNFLKDRTSSGALVSLEFLSSFMSYVPPVEAKDFDVCPILLAQPEDDRWTRELLSTLSLKNIKSEFTIKTLNNAGHYPIESPGREQLETYFVEFLERHL